MHSPVNLIVFNELHRDRLAEAETARLARQGKPAAAKRRGASRFQAFNPLRRIRTAQA